MLWKIVTHSSVFCRSVYCTSISCGFWFDHREPTQCVCVTDCFFIVNVLDLLFA